MDILKHWIEDHEGKVYSLQQPFSIGRSRDNTYVIHSDRVSRQHALVQARAEGQFWLTDLGSRNGVFLNRQPVPQSVRLKRGDVFQVADCQFTFHSTELIEIVHDADPASDTSESFQPTMAHQESVDSWLLIADIIGSVRLSQAEDPKTWTGKVGAWIGECRAIIERNGGTVAKFLGDGFLCHWSSERCSPQEIVESLAQLIVLQKSALLPFRLVIHYGSLQFTGISRGEISLTGNAVNFTFRLEKVASGLGKIMVASRPVVDACAGQLVWESLGPQTVPSFAEPCELFAPPEPAQPETVS